MRQAWTQRQPSGSMAIVEGLGLIEIYRDKDGMCVDINGNRAWSAWRASEAMIAMSMDSYISQWQYLNSFVGKP